MDGNQRPEADAPAPVDAPFSADGPDALADASLRVSPITEGAARALIHGGHVHGGMTFNEVTRIVNASGDLTWSGVVLVRARVCVYLGINPMKG